MCIAHSIAVQVKRYVGKGRIERQDEANQKVKQIFGDPLLGDPDNTGLASFKQATNPTVEEQLTLLVTVVPWGHLPCFYLKM